MEDQALEPKAFDLIVCHNVFHHFMDKGEALSRMASAMKDSGKLLIFHFRRFAQINDAQRKIHPVVLPDTIPHLSQVEALFRASGLKIDVFSDDAQGYLLSGSRS
jgi:demethylmenaquinone methyltransferase/2-methoxy-6-polyprenyl-1,4-benzoquinol methylase